MPRTGFCRMENNPVQRIFWGRVPITYAFASLFFRKGGRVQSLLHQIKYKGNHEAAKFCGEMMGKEFISVPRIYRPDLIVPVPLHPSKKRLRGYNQSERIAEAFSSVTAIPIRCDLLKRARAASSQTRLERWTRIENIKDVFVLEQSSNLSGNHILLIDDVITTGSTAESCLLRFSGIPGVRLSFAALACA